MFIIVETAARIEEEIDKLSSEEERRAMYQNIITDMWFTSSSKLEMEISNLFLKELVSVGEREGDFESNGGLFFCKNNVTGVEKEFHSIFEWGEWFTQEKNYSDKFSIRRPEWRYEVATLKFEWFGGWKDGGPYERWGIRGISNLPNSTKKEFLSEILLKANA